MSSMCDTCDNSYVSQFDGKLGCNEFSCVNGNKYVPIDIPIKWIQEQIKKNPGRHASSWQYLIDLWRKQELYGDNNGEKVTDEYVRLHKNPTAAQKFWRNE